MARRLSRLKLSYLFVIRLFAVAFIPFILSLFAVLLMMDITFELLLVAGNFGNFIDFLMLQE